jgi:regulator of sigma E protease
VFVFILVLGWLVFFHELGHFFAAKLCGIYCERFSIGMPPRLFGVKWGETDYCLGALPIGGYVKMAGQEDVPKTEEEREKEFGHVPPDRWFSNKPVWQRFFVIAAGPTMNLVLGILLYGIVALVGAYVPLSTVDNRIGDVEEDSPAASAQLYQASAPGIRPSYDGEPDARGWETGDRIVTIGGEPIKNIADVAMKAILGSSVVHDVEIERLNPDGTTTTYFSPVQSKVMDETGHARFGVAPFISAVVSRVQDGMPAQEQGVEPGDKILRVGGKIVDQTTFTKLVENTPEDTPIRLTLDRDGTLCEVTLKPQIRGKFTEVAFSPQLSWMELIPPDAPLKVAAGPEKVLKDTGLQVGDVILRIDGREANADLLRKLHRTQPERKVAVQVRRPVGFLGRGEETLSLELTALQALQAIAGVDDRARPVVAGVTSALRERLDLRERDEIIAIDGQPATVALLRESERSHPDGSLELTIRRPAIWRGLLRKESEETVTVDVARVGVVGVVYGEEMVYHRVPTVEVPREAVRKGFQAVSRVLQTVGELVGGGLSPRDLGGPLMIYQITTDAARLGYWWLLELTAFISVNLFIFNLLPLPVLDGGLLVFLTVEGVRRKPLDVRIAERIQKVGLVLIIGLMLYVTYNDILRWITNIIP